MRVPTHLKHIPVVAVQNYDHIDGKYAYNTDAMGLSIGLAQWNERGSVDISGKIWRYTDTKWSRQSEEMPLHRILDLAILLCKTREHIYGQNSEKTNIETVAVQGGAMRIEMCTDNQHYATDMEYLKNYLSENDEHLSERLHILANSLIEMGYGNRYK